MHLVGFTIKKLFVKLSNKKLREDPLTAIELLKANGRYDFNTSSTEMGRLQTRKAHQWTVANFLTKSHSHLLVKFSKHWRTSNLDTPRTCINPYPTAFPYGNAMVLHFYQQQESSTTRTVHKVINKGLKAYV